MSFVAALFLSCSWQPPEPAMRIAGEAIPRSELACPDRLPDDSEQCHELERLKTRRLLFDRMLDRAVASGGVDVAPDTQRQIEELASRMEPSFQQHALIMRCHAIAALQLRGEPVEGDPACMVVDDRQVRQLADSLSRAELRELVEEDLVAKMIEAQKANLRAEVRFGLIQEHLRSAERDEEDFWTEIYESLEPRFYDARLQMGPAEVITGDSSGWRGRESGADLDSAELNRS